MRHLKRILSVLIKCLCGVLVLFFFIVLLTHTLRKASNERDWSLDQAILPTTEFDGNLVTIRNIRNFSYTSTSTYTPAYYDKTFDVNELVSVDFIVEPLAPIAVAHTFVSFGFKNGDYVAISVEIRKEKGETYSAFKGLLNQYELMYVVVDERDALKLRALHRKDTLYLYPVITAPEKMRDLFVSMLMRANALAQHPEFYNTLTSTCTTNIADHINEISPGRIDWDVRLLFPLDADELAYELGLIDTSVSFSEMRKRHMVNEHIEQYQNDPQFSLRIREHLKNNAL